MSRGSPGPDEVDAARRRDRACDAFEEAWRRGERPRIEDALGGAGDPDRPALLRELLRVELAYRRDAGEDPRPAEYAARFPDSAAAVDAAFAVTTPATPPPRSSRPPDPRFAAGDTVAGRYRVVRRVGRGGMGEVYQADDLELGETVALKFLPPARAADPDWVARLKQEVALARLVTHENVCRVHDLGDDGGLRFLVMEYADRGSLAALCESSGRMDPDRVNGYARQLCDGLGAIHKRGLVHRDLKPGNVLLDADGEVRIADFGLAAVAADLTPDEAGAGTFLYMSPEQLDGRGVTARSDLFALGLILYELTTGRRPFPGESPAALRDQYRQAPPRPSALVPGLDPAFDHAILWCLRPDPQSRPGSARGVKYALPPLKPAQAPDPGRPLTPRVAAALLAAALLGLLADAALAPRTMAFHQLDPAKDPDYLRERAAELAADFGYTGPAAMEVGRLEWDADLVRHATRRARPSWPSGPGSPPMYYWYRASPRPLVPAYRVTPADPPPTEPGMVCVMLDRQGKLVEFHAVPGRKPPPGAQPPGDPGAKLLAAAGLNAGDFEKAPAHRRPPVFADEAWSYRRPGGLLVDVAVCDGRPVYFRVAEPFGGDDRPDRAEGEAVLGPQARQGQFGSHGLVVLLAASALAVPVTLRNLRLGRCDVTASVRLGAVYLAFALGGWALTARHSSSLDAERVLLVNVLGVVAFWGGLMVVMYLTLEPYMRRRWPERLSSWHRLLGGRLGDPLVGRDVLTGVAIGGVMALTAKLTALALGTFVAHAAINEVLTPDTPAGILASVVTVALVRAVNGFAYLILLGLILRREWAALAVLAALVAMNSRVGFPTFDPNRWQTWVGCGVFGGLVVFTIARFGLVTTLAAHFTATVINTLPVTLGPEPWYAGLAIVSAGVLAVLAVYGFFVSLGGQRLFPEEY